MPPVDHRTFDRLTRLFGASESRRVVFRVLLGSLIGGTELGGGVYAGALASSRDDEQGGDKKKRRQRGVDNARRKDLPSADKRDGQQHAKRRTGDGRGGADHED